MGEQGISQAMRVDGDVPCGRCGYNLRTLRVEGGCPECAAPVAESLRLFALAQEVRWTRLAWAALWLWSALAVRWVFMQFREWIDPWGMAHFDRYVWWGYTSIAFYILFSLPLCIGVMGMIKVRRGSGGRRAVRIAAWVLMGTLLVVNVSRGIYDALMWRDLGGGIRWSSESWVSGTWAVSYWLLRAMLLVLAAGFLYGLARQKGERRWAVIFTAGCLLTVIALAAGGGFLAFSMFDHQLPEGALRSLLERLVEGGLPLAGWVEYLAQVVLWPVVACWGFRHAWRERGMATR